MQMIASDIKLLYVVVQLLSHVWLFSKYLLPLFPSMKHFVGIKITQTCLYNLAPSHTNYLFLNNTYTSFSYLYQGGHVSASLLHGITYARYLNHILILTWETPQVKTTKHNVIHSCVFSAIFANCSFHSFALNQKNYKSCLLSCDLGST